MGLLIFYTQMSIHFSWSGMFLNGLNQPVKLCLIANLSITFESLP